MKKTSEPWYIHAVLTVVIIILAYVLLRVSILDPSEIMKNEAYWSKETHLRMDNLRQAEIIWQQRKGQFTDNLDSLINFIQTDTTVLNLISGYDSLRMRPTNPFKNLTHGGFTAESLYLSPKSGSRFILKVDTTVVHDTVVDRRGRLRGIDTTTTIGKRYYLACPDGYGTVGDVNLESDALLNAASWE